MAKESNGPKGRGSVRELLVEIHQEMSAVFDGLNRRINRLEAELHRRDDHERRLARLESQLGLPPM